MLRKWSCKCAQGCTAASNQRPPDDSRSGTGPARAWARLARARDCCGDTWPRPSVAGDRPQCSGTTAPVGPVSRQSAGTVGDCAGVAAVGGTAKTVTTTALPPARIQSSCTGAVGTATVILFSRPICISHSSLVVWCSSFPVLRSLLCCLRDREKQKYRLIYVH